MWLLKIYYYLKIVFIIWIKIISLVSAVNLRIIFHFVDKFMHELFLRINQVRSIWTIFFYKKKKKIKTTSFNTIPYESIIGTAFNCIIYNRRQNQNSMETIWGCKITSLPPNTHIHCHRYDRIKKLYSLYVVWGIHRRWQQIQQPGLKRFRRASKIT